MSKIPSSILRVTLAGAVSMLLSTPTWAHGGVYQGPGGGVPPGLRPPTDPVPPPPPPPPPPTTPPSTGGPITTSPPPTSTPTTGTPLTDPGTPGVTPRRGLTYGYDNWTFWWAYEGPAILRVKEAIYKIRGSAGTGLDAMKSGGGGQSDAHRLTEVRTREQSIPALLRLIDPARREHPDVRSAAYLALARVTDDPSHIPLLAAGVFGTRGAIVAIEDPIVRESAALSLGLLRRTDAARQFDAKELDRVRDLAFQIVEDDAMPTRTRAFAALSIGLLGDQPTLRGLDATTSPDGPPSVSGPSTGLASPAPAAPTAAARIFDDVAAAYAQADVPACLVLALSLQPPTTVTPAMTETLREMALKARFRSKTVDPIIASYAALALGRVGGAEHAKPLALALASHTVPDLVRRSAAIALGELGLRLDAAERRDVVASLVRAAEAAKDSSTSAFAVIAVARLLAKDAAEGRSESWSAKGARPAQWLLEVAARGGYVLRPYGALALGLTARGIGERPDVLEQGEFRLTAITALREGLVDRSLDARSRGAFAVGLGLAGDGGSARALLATLVDADLDRELRSYAALAIGMIGDPSKEAVDAIVAALKEKGSDELRLQAATALGLLGRRDAVDLLVKELADADTQSVAGQIVSSLGRIGDARAIPPLVERIADAGTPDLTRAMCVVGLGLVGDLEPVPSFTHLSSRFNYRACTEAVREFLSIL